MNCISLCQRADHVLNVGRMDQGWTPRPAEKKAAPPRPAPRKASLAPPRPAPQKLTKPAGRNGAKLTVDCKDYAHTFGLRMEKKMK